LRIRFSNTAECTFAIFHFDRCLGTRCFALISSHVVGAPWIFPEVVREGKEYAPHPAAFPRSIFVTRFKSFVLNERFGLLPTIGSNLRPRRFAEGVTVTSDIRSWPAAELGYRGRHLSSRRKIPGIVRGLYWHRPKENAPSHSGLALKPDRREPCTSRIRLRLLTIHRPRHSRTCTRSRLREAVRRESHEGAATHFTGSVHIEPLFDANNPSRAVGASVTFEPGAPTVWHTHPLGQTLIVTAGVG